MGAQLKACIGLRSYDVVVSEDSVSDYGNPEEDPFYDIESDLDEVLDENPWEAKTL